MLIIARSLCTDPNGHVVTYYLMVGPRELLGDLLELTV